MFTDNDENILEKKHVNIYSREYKSLQKKFQKTVTISIFLLKSPTGDFYGKSSFFKSPTCIGDFLENHGLMTSEIYFFLILKFLSTAN